MNPSIGRAAAVGALSGLAWGVAARVWMRMISTDPEFSWSGTLAIIGLATWLGMGVGLIYGTRKAERHRWLGLFAIPGLGLFLGAGMTLFPSFAFGSAMWNRSRSAVVRWLLVAVGAGSVLLPTLFIYNDGKFDEDTQTALPMVDLAILTIGYGLMSLSLAYAAWYLWRPIPEGQRADEGLQRTASALVAGGRDGQ